MVSPPLRHDIQDVIAPDINNVRVQYGAKIAHITIAPSAGVSVALRIARQLRARGHTVTGPDTSSPSHDLYVEETVAAVDDAATGEDSAEAEPPTDALLVSH